jgi:hypothetical protein
MLYPKMGKGSLDLWPQGHVKTGNHFMDGTHAAIELVFQAPMAGTAETGRSKDVFPTPPFHKHQVISYPQRAVPERFTVLQQRHSELATGAAQDRVLTGIQIGVVLL